ncbi:hypothetical protein NLI96_g12171 [Meripilus lineatus]|uniref:Uncharacterized protein n=1 Tax=Meripilus lineatus TaxID=2056292 RepID=A0AAD5Y7U7_9APHY|nr:hypothetical protein NLI96_g12171 [Physisporinus lineatus]
MPPTSSPVALEHLQEFIYYAYAFYCALLEERNLSAFSPWSKHQPRYASELSGDKDEDEEKHQFSTSGNPLYIPPRSWSCVAGHDHVLTWSQVPLDMTSSSGHDQ